MLNILFQLSMDPDLLYFNPPMNDLESKKKAVGITLICYIGMHHKSTEKTTTKC